MENKDLSSLKNLVDILQHDGGAKQEFLDYALTHAVTLTESKIGYIYHYSEETEEFILNTWSKGVMDECSVIQPQTRYELAKTGIWGEAVRQRKAIIVNDFEAPNPLKKGYPEGHVRLSRFMTVPVLSSNRIVAVVGVANKESEYTDADVVQLTLLMDSVFKVTALKDKENELQTSNRLLNEKNLIFSLFLEHSPIYVFFKDSEIRSLYLSRNFEKMLGRPIEDLLHKNMFELFPQDFAKKMVEDDKRIISENKQVVLEETFNGKYFTTIKFPINLENQPTMLAGFTIDVTEEHNTKEALVKTVQEWQTTFDASNDGIFLLDAGNRILRSNRQISELFGLDGNRIIGKHCWEIVHKTDAPCVSCPVVKARLSLKRESMELSIGDRWYIITADPIIDASGGLAGFVHTISDITERKTAENDLAENRDYLSAILDSMNQALFIYEGGTGTLLTVNNRMCELYGYTKEEALKLDPAVLSQGDPPYSRREITKWVEKVKSDGTQTFEWLARHSDGHLFWVEVAVAFATINEKPRFIATVTDIGQRKKFEAAMNNSQKLESLGILAGGIAHDFNNLLSGVFGYLSLAIHQSKDPGVTAFLEDALLVKERALALTQQLLTFSKGGAPVKQPGKFFPFIAETVKFALSGSNVSCQFDVDPELWCGSFDRNQLGQVFDNLVINAKQAMPLGGKLTVTANNRTAGNEKHPMLDGGKYVLISVQDTGPGIPEEFVDRIFDPFFTTKQTGSGLGLATAYSIVRQHGGIIEVTSAQGKGTAFNVFLPAAESSVIEESTCENAVHSGEGSILVMDDEEMILDLADHMLALSGYTVDRAKNASEALTKFAEAFSSGHRYAAVILDLTIPGGKGGADVVKEIRKSDPDVPVFVSSGYSDSPVMSNPNANGFTASIEKPFIVSDVMKILSEHMKSKKA